ncbi:MAG: RsmD family RNA methyltransferase [Limisphaerales bacterium]
MRIIAGRAGGVILRAPKGFEVRPTPDLVRQAIFNSLGQRVGGARVLELFAGTGALSLECLSRGATQALCVEKSSRHAEFIRENLVQSRLPAAALAIQTRDAFTAIRALAGEGQQFDLILADPPWGEKNQARRSTSFAQQLLDETALPALLRPGGLFILGHTKRDTLSLPPAWEESKMLKHGDNVIRFLQRPKSPS